MFLNCNYPNECLIPKGKPKELKHIKLELKRGNIRLLIDRNDNVYFVENGYYFGIELSKFLVKTIFGINAFRTIGKINMALLGWGDGRDHLYCKLTNEKEELLTLYLFTIRC